MQDQLALALTDADNFDAGSDSMNTLEHMRQRFLKRLPDTTSQLQRLWVKLSYFNWYAPAFRLFYSIISRLEKNCVRLGVPRVSEQSQALRQYLQHFLERGSVPDAIEKSLIQNMVDALVALSHESSAVLDKGAVLVGNAAGEASLQGEMRTHGLIYVLDPTLSAVRPLQAELGYLGHRVVCFDQPESFMAEVAQEMPSLVIMEVAYPEGDNLGFKLAEQVRDLTEEPVPIFFLSSRGDMSARLGAVRVGSEGFFTKPAHIDFLVKKIDMLFQKRAPELLKVLIVGGDAREDQLLVEDLAAAGIVAKVELNPLKFLETIAATSPDLIVLDATQTEEDARVLAQIMSQEALLGTLPIVMVEPANEDMDLHKNVERRVQQGSVSLSAVKPSRESCNNTALNLRKKSGLTVSSPDLGPKERQVVARLVNSEPRKNIVTAVSSVIHHAHYVRQAMTQLQRTDPVSGLLNRQYLIAELEARLATSHEAHPFTLFYITLDHVEILKRKAGLAWDGAIHQIASLLRANIPPEVTAGRLDDDTFVLIWPFWHRVAMTESAKNILSALRIQPINLPHNSIQVTASIGVAVITPELHDVPTLLTVGKHLALQAGKQGGNTFVQHSDVLDTVDKDMQRKSKAAIYEAVEQQAFRLVFQPILKTTDTSEELYEALLRLDDPNNKTVSPDKFLPIVAQNHLFPAVDRWVIQHAVDQLCHDQHAKRAASLFIKVSGESIGKKALLAWISNLKNSAGLRGHNRLIFEFSEAEICEHLGQVETFISGLPSLDCGFTLDHFGSTDYALALLDQIRVDYVKLHGPLVQSVLTDDRARLKVKSLIDKARQNHVEVIASSIESTKTMSLLWGWGVSHFQGYFIQQPHSMFDFDFKGIEL